MTNKEITSLSFNPLSYEPYAADNRALQLTYLRDTIGTSDDEQGNVSIVGVNAFRYKKVGSKFYIALESAATNLLTDTSENFAKWTPAGTVATFAKNQIGPTGEFDSDEIVFSATQTNGITSAGVGDLHGQTITYSVWLRSASGTPSVRMRLNSNTSYESIKALSTTWTRYTFTQLLAGGDTNSLTIEIRPDDTSAPTIYAWGVMIEARAVATTYFPTTPRIKNSGNLIYDSAMELDGTTNWSTVGTSNISKSVTIVKFGRQSMKVIGSGSGGDGVQQTITTVNATTYKVSVWAYLESGQTGFRVTFGSVGSGLIAFTGTGSWQYFEYAFKANSTSTAIQVTSLAAGGVATFYLDKLEVVQQLCPEPSFEAAGTPPSPWALAGTPTYTAEATVIRSGAKSAKLACAAATDGIKITNTDLALANNTWYLLSCWMHIVSQSGGSVVPKLQADANYNLTAQLAKSTVGAWQKVTAIFKTGTMAGADKLQVLQNTAGTLTFCLEDVSIIPLDAPGVTRNVDQLSIPLTNGIQNNMLMYSEQFDNAAWGKSLASVVANGATAPNGQAVADMVTVTAADNAYIEQVVTVVAGRTYCFSVYLRGHYGYIKQTNPLIVMIIDGGSTSFKFAVPTSRWRRYFVTYTPSVSTSINVRIGFFGNTPSTPSVFEAWGAQLEEGTSPSPYIATTTVKQSAIFSAIGSKNFNRSQGSLSFWAVIPWANTSGSFGQIIGEGAALSIEDGGAANENWNLKIRGLDKTGAVLSKSVAIPGTSTLSPTAEHHIAVIWFSERDSLGKLTQSRVKVYINGTKQVDQTYTDVQEWFYNQTSFIIANGGTQIAFIRDVKIFSSPIIDQDVTDLYTGAYI